MSPISRAFAACRPPVATGPLAVALAALVLGAPAAARPACTTQIHSATWRQDRAGAALVVTPTACGRRTASRTPRAAFDEAIRRGGRGAPNRRSLYWQFVCHAEFAPSKPTWNLETWRPDVGLLATITARCNPR